MLARSAPIGAAALLAGCAAQATAWHGTAYEPPRPAPDFALESMQGDKLQLADLTGKPLLLYFGYTSCPDYCPTTLADLSWVFAQLGEAAQGAQVLFVTVDPTRDTDTRLASFLGRFNPGFLGARAPDEASLDAILAAYDAYAQEDPAASHSHDRQNEEAVTFTHSARVFLIGPDGDLITHYGFGTPRAELLADLQQALGQEG